MHEHTDDLIKKRIVSAIKNGLFEIKQEMYGNSDRVNNSLPSRKLDKVANSIIREFQDEDAFEEPLWRRGGYDILTLYNNRDRTLYSFMSDKRFSELLNRKNIKRLHYIDILDEFNGSLEPENSQLSLFDDIIRKDEEKLLGLKNQILNLLHNVEPLKYITVCHSIEGFRLCSVKAVITSKFLEVIEQKDWSEFIDIDYSEAIFDDVPKNMLDEDIKVTLKANLPNRHDDFGDLNIPIKVEKDKKLE
ncbi:MAG: DUF5986 family protein [bacterium]|nr:DUF5986 family protein [bacterium]